MFKHIIRINRREWFENNYPLLTLAELYTRFPVEYNGSGTTTIIYRFTLLKFTETTRNYSHQLNNPYTILETIFLTSLNQRRRPNPVSHPSPWLKLHSHRRSKIIHLSLLKTAHQLRFQPPKKSLSCIPLPISSLLRN